MALIILKSDFDRVKRVPRNYTSKSYEHKDKQSVDVIVPAAVPEIAFMTVGLNHGYFGWMMSSDS